MRLRKHIPNHWETSPIRQRNSRPERIRPTIPQSRFVYFFFFLNFFNRAFSARTFLKGSKIASFAGVKAA